MGLAWAARAVSASVFTAMGDRAHDILGFAHCHSTRSYDGTMDHAVLREALLEAGCRFVCMTEHVENLTAQDIDACIEDCRRHSDDEFLFVPGIEMDHFVVYFLGLGPGSFDPSTPERTFASLRARSALCILSHPIKARYRYPEWILEQCDGIELINTKHDGHRYFRPQCEKLFQRLRHRNPAAIGLAGMDVHVRGHISDVHMRLTQHGPLTEPWILGELKAGRFLIERGRRPLFEPNPVLRALKRQQIHLMDAAHFGHRMLRRSGLKIPRSIREPIRRVFEGG